MHVLGVTDRGATDDAVERVVDRVVDRLSRNGRVGVVRYDATIADGTHASRPHEPIALGGDVTYDLGADGDWTATGTGMTVGDALDRLAIDCDYAIVVGISELQHPTIAVGTDAATLEPDGDSLLAAVESPGELAADDVDADLVDALEATEPYETLEALVERVKRSPKADRSGAVATFTGRVRAKESEDDARTEYLEFEKYEGVADERLATIETELEEREGVLEVELYHRTGVVEDGEDIVFVVVLAGHREEAFRTVEDGINRLKDEVPLFKKEVTVEDEFWVHDRP
ncbi:molybdopterin synthase [Natronobacterium gregoryi]|uniref:Bifunctional molybdopterin-guanine dinucleotide biosynthesis protein MobB/MoaE n=2 Tax=Natronobacterium gregoryi TaxID=44930 RepID=L0AI76_NATGS|nr:molybdopterin synthase [Natronobacterium gregoryi]AFZ73588.1 molybdopterin converting factor, large subunit [Natronobacterium gregoryi SP2]ELY68150.1 bifunctional molybdopterin-guanine dinucleotide biosynthesis protein MobB/MoaE [Natronobacterium gregoryi SP2]PLK20025.1 molybdopterin synthase [Natronobacterium gregoryi SP2]SFJ34862.1 molybdopterin synthase subunit MoaE /molybdopterin guanine dinucleotide biosynthesis accessory protein MobB [Natronobacterium gregoryi]